MKTINYLDKKSGWLFYPIIGISFIFFANDNAFFTLIRLPSFIWDVFFAIITSGLIGVYLYWLVRYLDKIERFSWDSSLSNRLMIQGLAGIIFPLTFALVFEMIYLLLLDINIGESAMFNLELPLAFLYLLMINLLYYLNYVSVAAGNKDKDVNLLNPMDGKIKVIVGAKEKLLPLNNIAFLKSESKILWLYTFDGQQIILQGTLKDWEGKLPKKCFYRINRQFILHRDTIESLETTTTRRMQVFLKNVEDDIYLPKSKVLEFRNWWENSCPV